jgi:YD repeat-containing protein
MNQLRNFLNSSRRTFRFSFWRRSFHGPRLGNANGNLIWQRNPDGTEYEWEYDNFDRVIKAPYIAPPETDWRNAYARTHRLPSMNPYEYAHSNPTNYTDPFGLWSYPGMYNVFRREYGEEGQYLLSLAASPAQGYVPVKRDYWFHDWYYEPGGVLGIASKWTDWSLSWSPRIWDDSDETAAKQLYAALQDRYGRTAGRMINCLCKLTPTYHWARQARDDPGFFEGPDM